MNHQCMIMMAAAFATVRMHLRPQEVHCAAAVHRSRASGVCPRAPIGNRFENHYTHLLTSLLPLLHPPPSIPFALQLPHLRAQMRAHLRTLWQTDGEERRRLCSRRYKALTCNSYSQQIPGRKCMHMEVVVRLRTSTVQGHAHVITLHPHTLPPYFSYPISLPCVHSTVEGHVAYRVCSVC